MSEDNWTTVKHQGCTRPCFQGRVSEPNSPMKRGATSCGTICAPSHIHLDLEQSRGCTLSWLCVMRRWDYCVVEKLGSRKSRKTGFDHRIRVSEPELKPRCGLKALSPRTELLSGEGPGTLVRPGDHSLPQIKHWVPEPQPGPRGLQSDGKPDWLLPEPALPPSLGKRWLSSYFSADSFVKRKDI